jgi:hypothetical protein
LLRSKFFAIVPSVAAMALVVSAGVEQQAPPQGPDMTFFVTSAGLGKGADLGGLEGADRQCQTLGQSAGAGGKTWRAYLSTQAADGATAVNARDRIGHGPWQNFKGEIVAKSVDDLHSDSNKLNAETSLTERGTMVPGRGFTPSYHDVLTGSQPDGRAVPPAMRIRLATIGRAAPRVRRWSATSTAKDCATTRHRNRGIHRICHAGLMADAVRTI